LSRRQSAGFLTVRSCTENRLEFPWESMVNFFQNKVGGLSPAGQSWTKTTERIGWLLLAALCVVASWVVALRVFRALLDVLAG
jgi:hypothetical protein